MMMLNIKIFRQTMCDGVGGHGKKKKVVVTGFGPFTGYPQNPSSMVVKKLMDDRFGETLDNGVELTLEIVEVDYEKAMATSCRVCDAIEADFVVHIGVHGCKRLIKLETTSYGYGYMTRDVSGNVPMKNSCPAKLCGRSPEKELKTVLDCDAVKHDVESQLGEDSPIHVELSNDPGRYLCGFIYYCSLQRNRNCAVFIHIPPFDEEATLDRVADVIEKILLSIIRRIL